jgi:hypothetical protein
MFDTKIAIVLRDNLVSWQALNVTAFLTTGIAAASPDMIGEPYMDKSGNCFNPMAIQPVIVLAADAKTIAKIHKRAIERGVRGSAYIEEMFATGHDAANRAVFADFDPESAKLVGLAFRGDRKVIDKIIKGAKMHP